MAVYTEVSFEELERLLEQYDIGMPLSFKGIAEGIENSNFYLQTDRGAFILTLYEKRVDPADLPFFLGLMEHLSARGCHCPLPVKTRDGRSLVSLNGRHAAIVTFLTGISLRRPDAAHCARGRACGTTSSSTRTTRRSQSTPPSPCCAPSAPRCSPLRRRRRSPGQTAPGRRRLRAETPECAGAQGMEAIGGQDRRCRHH